MFIPASAVVRHWFSKRCGLALGIIATGSSFGGIVFPVVGKNLLPLVGCVLNAQYSPCGWCSVMSHPGLNGPLGFSDS